jgi:hypothetical protein
MPITHFKKKKFVLRWIPEWDIKILVAALKFRKGSFIDWIEAEARGYLNGIPKNVSRQDLSHRISYFLHIKYGPVGHKKKQRYNKSHPYKGKTYASLKRKKSVFKILSDENKSKFGYKPRGKWTADQKKILLYLAEKYRKSPITIDWRNLIKDSLVSSLPEHPLNRLRSYYWCIITNKRPDVLEKRRKAAREYKKKNYKNYRKSLTKGRKIVINSVNDFLATRIEKR